ncbi:hypothetical protein C7S20_08950 [Christiangramia fulva]|uniref:Uncharacterized protein n=1 Tax=Christiangramia fulva TaxID=2126553 RepID=A0A2R3Z531_9FLAO|nr:DUF6090 family protein [Christiangramia fulva]AVR45387.1 hypothetical protein C7S20_08950 [Christiangramia fulva]
MIKLFRNIRRKLLTEGNSLRYLKYAIGEIILVVIGILIALQINTWNENRTNKIKETAILRDLHQEFQKNKVKLDSTINYHRSILRATKKVMDLIGEPEATVLKHNPDSLIYLTLDYRDYSPSESVISDLISSGKLNLISSDSLRMLIFEWGSAMEEEEEGYATMDEMSQTMTLPYIAKNGSMKNTDHYGILKENSLSKFGPRNHLLFQEVEFENHMDNQAWGVANYLLKLDKLEIIINDIIKHTNRKTMIQE